MFKFRLSTLERMVEGEREGDNMLRKEGRDDDAAGWRMAGFVAGGCIYKDWDCACLSGVL